jgi:GIY-YIG catalytic domain
MQALYYIYCIENIQNGKIYVGMTEYLQMRIAAHFQRPSNRRGLRGPMTAHQEIDLQIQNGPSKFICRKLGTANNKVEAEVKEQVWIRSLRSDDPQFGYNVKRKIAAKIRRIVEALPTFGAA